MPVELAVEVGTIVKNMPPSAKLSGLGTLIEPVSSSNLVSVGYNPDSETLEIEFKSTGIYEYYNVPQFMYERLMQAGLVCPSWVIPVHCSVESVTLSSPGSSNRLTSYIKNYLILRLKTHSSAQTDNCFKFGVIQEPITLPLMADEIDRVSSQSCIVRCTRAE